MDDFIGDVSVVAEDRQDVGVELAGVAYGPDDSSAAERAAEVHLDSVRAGDSLRITVRLPSLGRRPRLDLTVRTPRLAGIALRNVRGTIDVSGVATADVVARHGNLRIVDVRGAVRGEHRDGRLELMRVGDVDFSVRDSNTRIERAEGRVECSAADSKLELREVSGSARLEIERSDADLDRLSGRVRIDARDGRVNLRDQRQAVEFEGDRAHFAVTMAAPVELRAISRDEAVQVRLVDDVGATLDLEAEDGNVRLPDRTVAVQRTDRIQRARGTIGGGGATIIVRTERGDIEVRR